VIGRIAFQSTNSDVTFAEFANQWREKIRLSSGDNNIKSCGTEPASERGAKLWTGTND
jgi:hypothetical protein